LQGIRGNQIDDIRTDLEAIDREMKRLMLRPGELDDPAEVLKILKGFSADLNRIAA